MDRSSFEDTLTSFVSETLTAHDATEAQLEAATSIALGLLKDGLF